MLEALNALNPRQPARLVSSPGGWLLWWLFWKLQKDISRTDEDSVFWCLRCWWN